MRKIIASIIIGLVIIIMGILNVKYFDNKEILNEKYVAIDSPTALNNIAVKKELIDAKRYYAGGDKVKYKFTITNNNSESVKINILDNYNFFNNNQSNLVLKNAKCNNSDVNISSNKIELKEIEIASKATYTCTVEGISKETYPEGKVDSKVKVYIDDEDENKESDFTYIVRDSILDFEQSVNKYSFYYNEPIEYTYTVKNISDEEASENVEIILNLASYYKILNLETDFFKVTKTGAKREMVSSNFKASCKTPEGKICSVSENQIITFNSNGINPGETVTITFKVDPIVPKDFILGLINSTTVNEYENDIIKKSWFRNDEFSHINGPVADDLQGEIYFINSNGKILDDLYDLEYTNGWAKIILNNNFYKTPSDKYEKNDEYGTTQVNEIESLPAGMEYDVGNNAIITGCLADSKSEYELNTKKLYNIISTCNMKNNSKTIYSGNIKVPLKVNTNLLNKYICIVGENQALMYGQRNDQTNNFCMGPNLHFSSGKVTNQGNVLSFTLDIKNSGNGRGENVKVVYTYENGLDINADSLGEGVINKTKKTITWTIPLIRAGETISINFKATNLGNLTSIKAIGTVEDVKFEQTLSIVASGQKYEKGDWNLNGEVNVSDVIYARKYVAQAENLSLPPAEVYDFNDDNDASIIDIIGLRQLIANK